MSTDTIISHEQRRAANRAARNSAITARRQNLYTRSVIDAGRLFSDDGYGPGDVSLEEFAVSEGQAVTNREARRTTDDFVNDVKHFRGLLKAVELIQRGHPDEAITHLKGFDDARAVTWVPKVAQGQRASTAAIHAWRAALEHETACIAEADKFGGRRAKNPTPEGWLVIERLIEAEHATHAAWMAKVESGKKLAWHISAMTRVNFFDAINDTDLVDQPATDKTPAEPVADWRAATGVQHIVGH